MRLFALEVLALTETHDPNALDALSAEFTRLIGQAPGDGAFELTPGRQGFLLSSDVVVEQYGGGYGGSPPEASPIDIELPNACILAWKALTDSNPRFDTDNPGTLDTQERPPGVTVARMPKFVAHGAEKK
ncbi:MAG: hypothetical protein O2856_12130 [Planctomycetota bacterium]|nr:hypothetical protein [Planctomycetota bacterium]